MKSNTKASGISPSCLCLSPPPHTRLRLFPSPKLNFRSSPPENGRRKVKTLRFCRNSAANDKIPTKSHRSLARNRRDLLATSFVVVGSSFLHSIIARAEDKPQDLIAGMSTLAPAADEEKKGEAAINSRIYDATAIGEPVAVGNDKRRVWEKLMNARIVYLGEAEQVPVREDKDLELGIVTCLRSRCSEQQRSISVAIEAFPCNLQEQLDRFMEGRIDDASLKSYVTNWPPQRWQEYEPLLRYCRDNAVQIIALGTPLEVLRIVQAEGIHGLSKAQRKLYTPPAGSGFIAGFSSVSQRSLIDRISPNQSVPFGPSSYLSAQARVVEDYTMSQIIAQAASDGSSSSMLVVITSASHVLYGPRGIGLPARISKKLQKKSQAVILLNPERQDIRREGEVPVADFLWYSAARPCSRNCFDRAEIARVMNAASKSREALPQDLQKGLDLGVVSPEVLQNFFDLEQYPLIAELTHRFQGFRERLLADPKFLHRLAIEEAISITTTLMAQYERRKEHFFEELDYVITDTVRGSVVDFFTVWLPAPTISFLSYSDEITVPENLELLKGLLGSVPDNAFQRNSAGKDWNLTHRLASVFIGGLKLAGVGFISSIGAVAASNVLFAARKLLNPASVLKEQHKRSPIFKTAVIYGCFLGTSANLRYQMIAGVVEHRMSDGLLSSQPLLVNMLSFIARTINSYWGTQQWVDLARLTGLQTRKSTAPVHQHPHAPSSVTLDGNDSKAVSIDDIKNQSGDNNMS